MAEGVSKRRVCRLLGLSRSVLDDHARPRDDGPLIKALSAIHPPVFASSMCGCAAPDIPGTTSG
ncbi:hypothetical protein L0E83_05990 [Marichromatium gracile]|uniref:hypothetical protein n=1 Tax=Marichromatium gracile TaxID=1048 RepID=UPI001F3F7263|nr:hypothetical protein [Marichromatium gracile]MCF1182990.1 hypothetical protein [Marichromatium gracile]